MARSSEGAAQRPQNTVGWPGGIGGIEHYRLDRHARMGNYHGARYMDKVTSALARSRACRACWFIAVTALPPVVYCLLTGRI